MDQTAKYPAGCDSVGKKIGYLSSVLLPARRFGEYTELMGRILDEEIHYIDPVHSFRTKSEVLAMLAKYVPRAANGDFKFRLIVDGAEEVVWSWTISLKIKFTPFKFKIDGLVHARVRAGKIIFQREYYDPMQSIGVVPIFGRVYQWILRTA